jgi:hypothetical protein
MLKNKKTYLSFGFLLMGVVLIYVLAAVVVPRVMVTLTKAAPSTKVSLNNSYFIGGKVLAVADGKDACVVNVFVLDDTGKGIKGKGVELTGMDEPQTEMSSADGRATFEVKSIKEGQFTLEASIEGNPMPRTVKVTFRN